jgi:hypothetical protein
VEPEGLVWWGGVAVTTDERDAVCKRYGVRVHYTVYDEFWYTIFPEGGLMILRNFDTMTPSEFEDLVLTRVIEETFTP